MDLLRVKEEYTQKQKNYTYRVLVCGGAGCISSHCKEVQEALRDALVEYGLEEQVEVLVTGCMGTCAAGPVLLVEPDGIFYTAMDPEKVADTVQRHLVKKEI